MKNTLRLPTNPTIQHKSSYSCKFSYWILIKFRIVTYFHHHIHQENWATDIQYILPIPDNLHFQCSRLVFLLDCFVWDLLLKSRWITTLSACTFLHNIFSPLPYILLLLLTPNHLITRLLWSVYKWLWYFVQLYAWTWNYKETRPKLKHLQPTITTNTTPP